jgi:hypothetical protein
MQAFVLDYNAQATPDSTPASGQARTDTTSGATASWLYLAYVQAGSSDGDKAPILRGAHAGEVVRIAEFNDSTTYAEFDVTGNAVDDPADEVVAIPIGYHTGTAINLPGNTHGYVFRTTSGMPVFG